MYKTDNTKDCSNHCCVEPKGLGPSGGRGSPKAVQIAPRSAWFQSLPSAPWSLYSVFLCQT